MKIINLSEKKVIWNEFSCILKPSTLGGIGVFAAHDLPLGMQVFTSKSLRRQMKIKDISPDFLKYCIFLNDEECFCPERFDRMEIGWFLNHSYDPNIEKISSENVVTVKEIKTGEELLIDYNKLNEPEHLKEPYYRDK